MSGFRTQAEHDRLRAEEESRAAHRQWDPDPNYTDDPATNRAMFVAHALEQGRKDVAHRQESYPEYQPMMSGARLLALSIALPIGCLLGIMLGIWLTS